MKVIPVRSDGAYLKIMNAPFDKKMTFIGMS